VITAFVCQTWVKGGLQKNLVGGDVCRLVLCDKAMPRFGRKAAGIDAFCLHCQCEDWTDLGRILLGGELLCSISLGPGECVLLSALGSDISRLHFPCEDILALQLIVCERRSCIRKPRVRDRANKVWDREFLVVKALICMFLLEVRV
jgi:hypothetical protein